MRKGIRKEHSRSLPAMFVYLAFVPYFLSRAIAPSAAFVTTKSKGIGSSLTASTTRMFFQHQNFEMHEHRKNSTDIAMSGVAPARKQISARATRSSGSSTELSAISSSMDIYAPSGDQRSNGNKAYKVYCDMDGCLVNFEKGVRSLLKTGSSNLEKQIMWEGISRAPRWFEELEWQMDGRRLWSAIKHLNPDILTGVPDIKSSRVEKFNWCKRELGIKEADAHHVDMAADGLDDHQSVNGNFPRKDKTNIITCWSNNKFKEAMPNSILIDDRIDLKKNWEAAGGIFIHHVNTETTIRKLCELGVITERQIADGENGWYWEGDWNMWGDN